MPTVTYLGPSDAYIAYDADGAQHILRRDNPTDVPAELADQLRTVDGHSFNTGATAPSTTAGESGTTDTSPEG